ncbi:MAG: pyridoxal phosphate-dependent aminotransferase [Vicinamibacterales bacterium]
MRSSRLPPSLDPNPLARAIAEIRRRGGSFIDLTESNPTRVGLTYSADLLAPLADPEALAYDPQPLGLWSARAAVAGDFRRRGIVISADRVAITASTSEAYALLFKLWCDPGDVVLVPRPGYPLFDQLTRLESVVARPYDLEYHGSWRIDLESLGRALDRRVRAILVVSPNNPTGSYLHRDDLSAIVAMCNERGCALVGDEVFADYPLEPAPAAATVLSQSDVLTASLGGLSKSAGLPQVKLGWIGFGGPSAAVDEALAAFEIVADTFLSASTPVQVAAPQLIERGAAIREQIQTRIRANLDVLRQQAAAFPSVDVLPVEGGWSAVIQVPSLVSEESLALDVLTSDGVLVHPGYFFDFSREAFVAVSLLVEPEHFIVAIGRVLRRATRGVRA